MRHRETGHADLCKYRFANDLGLAADLFGPRSFQSWPAPSSALAVLDSPQVLRGMENLKLALRLRLSRGPLNEDQINAVAAALDAAATGVKRI